MNPRMCDDCYRDHPWPNVIETEIMENAYSTGNYCLDCTTKRVALWFKDKPFQFAGVVIKLQQLAMAQLEEYNARPTETNRVPSGAVEGQQPG